MELTQMGMWMSPPEESLLQEDGWVECGWGWQLWAGCLSGNVSLLSE